MQRTEIPPPPPPPENRKLENCDWSLDSLGVLQGDARNLPLRTTVTVIRGDSGAKARRGLGDFQGGTAMARPETLGTATELLRDGSQIAR